MAKVAASVRHAELDVVGAELARALQVRSERGSIIRDATTDGWRSVVVSERVSE